MSTFFPVGEDMQAIVTEWISFLAAGWFHLLHVLRKPKRNS
jgi:hypothetical protein